MFDRTGWFDFSIPVDECTVIVLVGLILAYQTMNAQWFYLIPSLRTLLSFYLNHLFISLDKTWLKSVAGKTSTFIAEILIIPLLYKAILFTALARFSVFALYYFVEIKTFNFSVMEQC